MASGVVHEIYLRRGWLIVVPLGLFLFVVSEWNILYPLLLYLNFSLCEYVDPDADVLGLTKAEGDVLRFARKMKIGILGAVFVSYWFIYAFIINSYLGGHRSKFSHGIFLGTVGRMIWFNIPVAISIFYFINYSIANWNTPPLSEIGLRYYWMNIWLKPYLLTQFLSWFVGDGIHILLDSSTAKGRLYNFKKFGDLRTNRIKAILILFRIKDKDIDR